jgi:hypothetical protein
MAKCMVFLAAGYDVDAKGLRLPSVEGSHFQDVG